MTKVPNLSDSAVTAAYLRRSLQQLGRFARNQGFHFTAHLIEVAGEATVESPSPQPQPRQNALVS